MPVTFQSDSTNWTNSAIFCSVIGMNDLRSKLENPSSDEDDRGKPDEQTEAEGDLLTSVYF